MFDRFVMVDWSAANQPRTGRDSIWICDRDRTGRFSLENPPTRALARAALAALLAAATARGERVLLGFDFPFGYPAGFAARLGLAGPAWRALWDAIAALIEDQPDNRNNRFLVAAELNRRVGAGGGFPFWGRPAALDLPDLGMRHHRRHGDDPLAERRLIDRLMPSAQPCWKLLGAGSVGGQALTGIPIVRALRDDPRWADGARVWPLETGLAPPPPGCRVVFAEIYPSWWAVRPEPGEPKDAAQVRTVAALLHAAADDRSLAAWFAGVAGLTQPQRAQVIAEEAWTLGVTAPEPGAAGARRGFAAAAPD